MKARKVVTDKARFKRRLSAGRRACPPEDCRGVLGYERMVKFAMTGEDPWEDDPESLAEWLGDWNPDGFDLENEGAAFNR